MKQSTRNIVAVLALAGLLPTAAMAATATATLNVTATTVLPTASISVAGALAFGSVLDTDTAIAQTSFDVTASTGWPYAITLDGGANYNAGSVMKDSGGQNARGYALYKDAALSNIWGPSGTNLSGLFGTGAAQSYTLYGLLYSAPGTSGAISDTVTITVTY